MKRPSNEALLVCAAHLDIRANDIARALQVCGEVPELRTGMQHHADVATYLRHLTEPKAFGTPEHGSQKEDSDDDPHARGTD